MVELTNPSPNKRLLQIPSETESSADFRKRLAVLLKADATQIYIDTSFLMWLTKIGATSRAELFSWLDANCPGRVHVPIWAAHEYLKHHVSGTIVAELDEKTEEVASLVGGTYAYFRPFIDEPLGKGAEDPATVRATTRAALNALSTLTAITRQWHKSYQKNSSEVIAFINAKTPPTSSVYDELKDVAATGPMRFVGSVPPGFQDRRKSGSRQEAKTNNDEPPPDSNRFGDLVFWKELLSHAKAVTAKTVVVFTNDRKNDWHLGRSENIIIDDDLLALRKSWKPVPRPHPMLLMEARITTDVDELELLDAPYLAALLRDSALDEVRAFADVAIIPDGPEPVNEQERRAKAVKDRLATDAQRTADEATERGFLFPDPSSVQNTKAKLTRALLESRGSIDESAVTLLETWRASVEANEPVPTRLNAGTFDGLDEKQLVKLARELHDRVLVGVPGFAEAVADVISVLDQLPSNTAACFYLGLLASAYLMPETNATRLPPASPVLQSLFERQSADYATNPIAVLAKRLADNMHRPLYVPDTDKGHVEITFDTQPDTELLDELGSLKIGSVELLTPAQADEDLRLAKIFQDAGKVSGEALLHKACALFGLPEAQMQRTEVFGNDFALTTTIGFKRPADISIPKGG